MIVTFRNDDGHIAKIPTQIGNRSVKFRTQWRIQVAGDLFTMDTVQMIITKQVRKKQKPKFNQKPHYCGKKTKIKTTQNAILVDKVETLKG